MGNACRSSHNDVSPIRKNSGKSKSSRGAQEPINNSSTLRRQHLTRLATFQISSCETRLVILSGPIVEFSYPPNPDRAAIVNATNKLCLGGGGVDGAINRSGGHSLRQDRAALPVLSGSIRCQTGDAKVNGPGDYGKLHAPFVIHAVGPNYEEYSNFDEPDRLLAAAYCTSLDCALQQDIEGVAFSLISAGNYRGRRSLEDILRIAVTTICNHLKEKEAEEDNCIEDVFLCAFRPVEAQILVKLAQEMDLERIEEEHDNRIYNNPTAKAENQ